MDNKQCGCVYWLGIVRDGSTVERLYYNIYTYVQYSMNSNPDGISED